MASSPVTAPSSGSNNSSSPSPSTSDAPPPSSNSSSSPPPSSSSPSPPPPHSSPPPATPPPPQSSSSSPPPPDSSNSPPPPSSKDGNNNNNKNNNDNSSIYSPPPPHSSSSSSSKQSSSNELSPPPSNKSHTPSHSKSSKDSPSHSSHDTDKTPLIVGITAGVILLFIALVLIITTCRKKKKRRLSHNQMQFYGGSHGRRGSIDFYNDSGQRQSWHNSPQSVDHAIKLSQASNGAGGWAAPPPGAGGGSWHPMPPLMSGGGISSGYSGPHQPVLPPPPPTMALGLNQSTFTYDELAAATNGFSQANLLGQGGFGYVHKGVLANGKVVAVKSLKSGSGQGDREFHAEVDIISRVHHRHLVSLVGYCIAGGQRMLVYEFVPNGTLEYHLYGKDRPVMDWPTRLRIALGSAKGLAYLHEDCHPRIIHRDIKAANILLDENFEAMVADFGLAKLSNENHTHVSTRVMGTFGYLAPEYASSGKLTEKSDVFSFGVMLLELITGRPPVDTTNSYMEDSLVDWARPLMTKALEDGNFEGLVDPRLENNYEPHEMAQMVACAACSIRHSGRRRPKMSQIVRALEGDVSLEDLNEGIKPGQSSNFSSHGGSGSDYDTGLYNADMKKFRKTALQSREMDSSDFNQYSSSGDSPEMGQR